MMKILNSYVLCVVIKFSAIIMASLPVRAARVFLSKQSKTIKGTHVLKTRTAKLTKHRENDVLTVDSRNV